MVRRKTHKQRQCQREADYNPGCSKALLLLTFYWIRRCEERSRWGREERRGEHLTQRPTAAEPGGQRNEEWKVNKPSYFVCFKFIQIYNEMGKRVSDWMMKPGPQWQKWSTTWTTEIQIPLFCGWLEKAESAKNLRQTSTHCGFGSSAAAGSMILLVCWTASFRQLKKARIFIPPSGLRYIRVTTPHRPMRTEIFVLGDKIKTFTLSGCVYSPTLSLSHSL